MIDKLIDDLITENGLPNFVYNQKEFVPGESTILYSGPLFDNNESKAVIKSFLTGRWASAGEYSSKFENRFAKRFDVDYAQFVNSGSSANLVLISALKTRFKWNDGDEIIVSPVGFPTTIAPIVQNNLKPVFIDIEMDTLNFDINKIESKITGNTRAIFVSPVLGNPPNMNFLKGLCDKHKILLIGDNCDSLMSAYAGQDITKYYFAWTTSFYVAHHMTTIEGGMVCSNDKALMDLARSYVNWGRDCYCSGSGNLLACGTCGKRFDKHLDTYDGIVDHKYVFTTIGYNLKPLDIQGAIGLEQLKKLPIIESARKKNFKLISGYFTKYVPQVRIASSLPMADTCWFGVPLICDTHEIKVKLQNFLEDNKWQTRNYFGGNLLCHPAYKHLDDYKNFPNANLALSNVFFVGVWPGYTTKVRNHMEEILIKWSEEQ